MNRRLFLALFAALPVLCASGASGAPGFGGGIPTNPPLPVIPNLLQPELFPGFEPIPPDEFGTSPLFRHLVFQDERGFHVIRQFDAEEIFRTDVVGLPEVGFDPLDRRLYLIERRPTSFRFRFIDLETGLELLDQSFLDRPEIRLNADATINILAQRGRGRTQAQIFDDAGIIVTRRSYGQLVQWGINRFFPAVAFVDPGRGNLVSVEVFSVLRGIPVLRETTTSLSPVGFAPQGPGFVITRRTSPSGFGGIGGGTGATSGTFTVKLFNSLTGRRVMSRSFSGFANAGFTPESTLLGVVAREGRTERLFLFRTDDGRQVFLR